MTLTPLGHPREERERRNCSENETEKLVSEEISMMDNFVCTIFCDLIKYRILKDVIKNIRK